MRVCFAKLCAALLFLAACGGSPSPTSSPPRVEVSVSGDASFTASAYTVEALPESNVISIRFHNGDQYAQLFFEPEAQPNSVSLIGSTDAMNPNRRPLNGVWLLVQGAPGGAEPVYYSKDPRGSVTLTARGAALSGIFEITVASADGAQVTASGRFDNVPAG